MQLRLDRDLLLRQHWQRQPGLFPGALSGDIAGIDARLLSALASNADIDSRRVTVSGQPHQWHCEPGPFEDIESHRLTEDRWSLLVQSVDQHCPAAAELRDLFDFLPRWRVDDVMVSLSASGGGVGPHFDYYDVFLVQTSGRRRWRLGARCDDTTELVEHPSLRLLPPFEPTSEYDVAAGDVLYIPAGFAHEGVATSDDCITCSVGFRAPSYAEILQCAVGHLASKLSEDQRYRDPPEMLTPDQAENRFEIGQPVIERLESIWAELSESMLEGTLVDAFAELMTETSTDWVQTETNCPTGDTSGYTGGTSDAPSFPCTVALAPETRAAYRNAGGNGVLFINGDRYDVSLAFARGICSGHLGPREPTCEELALLDQFVEFGWLEITSVDDD